MSVTGPWPRRGDGREASPAEHRAKRFSAKTHRIGFRCSSVRRGALRTLVTRVSWPTQQLGVPPSHPGPLVSIFVVRPSAAPGPQQGPICSPSCRVWFLWNVTYVARPGLSSSSRHDVAELHLCGHGPVAPSLLSSSRVPAHPRAKVGGDSARRGHRVCAGPSRT